METSKERKAMKMINTSSRSACMVWGWRWWWRRWWQWWWRWWLLAPAVSLRAWPEGRKSQRRIWKCFYLYSDAFPYFWLESACTSVSCHMLHPPGSLHTMYLCICVFVYLCTCVSTCVFVCVIVTVISELQWTVRVMSFQKIYMYDFMILRWRRRNFWWGLRMVIEGTLRREYRTADLKRQDKSALWIY